MAQDIKTAFFDIDGTLTSFVTHVVPQSTVDALHALQRNGVKVFICSGRAPSYMGVVLDTIPVTFDGIDVVANYAESDYGYFNRTNAALERTWNSLGKTAPKIDVHDPRERIANHSTFQISPYVDETMEAEIASMCSNVRGVRWHPAFTDLIPADGGKAVGMQVMLEHFGWTKDNAIAFGDGGNDVDMLRFAGIGVAMGNATDEPKAAADYVTDSVDDAGIANALKHFGVI